MSLGESKTAADGATRVEFALTSEEYPFVGVARAGGAAVLEEILPRGDGAYAEFFLVSDIAPDDVAAIAGERGVEADVVTRYDDGGIVELVVDDGCPAVHLAEQGVFPRDVYGDCESSAGRIVAEIPTDLDAGTTVERFLEEHPDADLVSKRDDRTATPTLNGRAFQRLLEERLSRRQRQAIAHAHEAGYYEWPRRTTADELADDLDVSAPTFHKHLRRAEGKLVAALFEAPSVAFDEGRARRD